MTKWEVCFMQTEFTHKPNLFFLKGDFMPTKSIIETLSTVMPEKTAVPTTFVKRIGSTNYIINIHFSDTAKETIEDKILRMIESEVSKSA
jgi:hypothetical protein